MLKKVSVIIPFYSSLQWLVEAVESALNQTYKHVEIIIVNDGSKEDMHSFLNSYGNLIVYRYQENKGAASARNHAISIASGDYVAFLDSDDIWLPDKLEKQIAFMQEVNAKWSHTNYFYWNTDKSTLKNVAIYDEYGDIFKKIFVSVKMATPSIVIDSDIFKNHPDLCFSENHRIGEDIRLWHEISKLYPIALLREPLVKVRLRQDNTYKKTLTILNLRAKEFKEFRNNPNAPFIAKLKGFVFLLYSKVFRIPSTPFKDFLARIFLIVPYLIGRIYVKYLSLFNNEYKHLVL